MPASSSPFEIGDAVRVKDGVRDADFPSTDIGGWQGRIVEVLDGEPTTLVVEWDSVTLAAIPDDTIDAAEQKGLDWTQYTLRPDDVVEASARDAPQDVRREQRRIREQHVWTSLGDEGVVVQEIIDEAPSNNARTLFYTWESVLQRRLTFPIPATVDEFYRGRDPGIGDDVEILSVVFVDCLYGLIATVQFGRQSAQIPLADLEPAKDVSPEQRRPLRAYRVWFANR